MTLKNSLIAGFTLLGITGTVVGLNQTCVFDAEVMDIQDQKICFSTQSDYRKYKNDRIAKLETQGNIYLWTGEGQELLAVIQHEIEKKGKRIIRNPRDGDDMLTQIINSIK